MADSNAKPDPASRVSLLAQFGGAEPQRPAWFTEALSCAPERSFTPVAGASIETLAWGERGRPGLLFLHGNGANADWWSFIAPFFARTHRVAALSFSGMGGSEWRESYSLDLHMQETFAVAEALGLFESPEKPLFVAHSYGGYVLMAGAAHHGGRLRGTVMVDSAIRRPEEHRSWTPPPPRTAHKIYASLPDALARFRFAPTQDCEHLFIADFIARASLKTVPNAGEEGGEGWTWRFDPSLWGRLRLVDLPALLAAPRCPLAQIVGDRSRLVAPPVADFMRETAPQGSPWIEIPDADHHVMVDQPLAFVAALRGLLVGWP